VRLLTNDLYEGAWFLSQGMELSDLWMDGNAKRSIVFEFIGDRLEGLKEEYRKGKAQANVIQLKRAMSELKDRMFWLIRNKELNPPKCARPSDCEAIGVGAFGGVNQSRLRKGGNHVWSTQYAGRATSQ
jgi:hypothetical protein